MNIGFDIDNPYIKQYENFWTKMFGNKRFVKSFFKLAIPAILQTLISIIVLYVDNFSLALFVKDANEATSAKDSLGLANPLINFQIYLSIAWLGGTGIMMAQYFGKQDTVMTKRSTSFRLWTSLVVQMPFIILTLVLPGKLIEISSGINHGLSYELGKMYLFFTSFSFIPYVLVNTLSYSLQETNRPIQSFIFALVAMTINIILDPIVIIFSKNVYQAVILVSITTMIARVVQLILLIVYILVKHDQYIYFFKSWFINKSDIIKIIKYGSPTFINEVIYTLLNTTSVICLLSFNPAYHNATTNTVLIIEFTTIIWPGISAACVILVGSELGKNKVEQAKRNANKLLSWGCVFAFFIAMVVFLLSFFINPILSPAASNEMNNIAIGMQWIFIIIVVTQGVFSVLYFSIRAGGSKVIIFTDSFIMIITNIITMAITFTNTAYNWNPLGFLFFSKYEEVIKMVVAIFIFKYFDWAKVLTVNQKNKPALNFDMGEIHAI